MKKMMKNEKGFTLIELIIVIAILAIIAAVAIPNILGAVDNSRKSTDIANAKIIANAAAQIIAKNEDIADEDYLGTAADNALSVSDLDGSAAADTFEDLLYIELNSNPPVPKYKGTAVTEDDFVLVIDADRAISVYVGDAVVIAAADTIELYPKTAADYKQN